MTTGIPALLLLLLPLALGSWGWGAHGTQRQAPPHTHTLPHHRRPCFSRCGEPRENRLQLEPRHLDSALMEVAPTGVEGSEFCIPGAGAGGWNSQFSE